MTAPFTSLLQSLLPVAARRINLKLGKRVFSLLQVYIDYEVFSNSLTAMS